MAENFDLIFGQNASQQYAWNDTDYQNGWKTIGNIPPTATQFDALQRRSDMKTQELNSRLANVEQSIAGGAGQKREPETEYTVGTIKTYDDMPFNWVLECIVGGTSGSADITIPSPTVEGARIIDGTVTWALRKIATYGGVGYRQSSTACPTGSIAFSTSLPTGWYLECTGTGGITSASDLVITSPTVGATVTDGTVVWTIRKLTTVDIPDATNLVAGIMRLFSSKGSNTNGTMTQQAITNALNNLESLIGSGGGIVASNLATNGYAKFANGLIIQWGKATPGASTGTIIYNITFPSNVYTTIITCGKNSGTGAGSIRLNNMATTYTRSSFDFASFSGAGTSNADVVTYVAFGK